jgi:glucokinase
VSAVGRHRALSDRARWRPLSTQVVIPVPRRSGIEVVDAQTQIRHRVSVEALLAGRLAGIYETLCGARVLAASLTDPGRGRCTECAG